MKIVLWTWSKFTRKKYDAYCVCFFFQIHYSFFYKRLATFYSVPNCNFGIEILDNQRCSFCKCLADEKFGGQTKMNTGLSTMKLLRFNPWKTYTVRILYRRKPSKKIIIIRIVIGTKNLKIAHNRTEFRTSRYQHNLWQKRYICWFILFSKVLIIFWTKHSIYSSQLLNKP